MGARNFREYPVWKEAVDYATYVYKVTGKMPWFEKKGLCDQLQRAVVSISSNIAEGAARSSDADFAHFLDQALGSAYEVETQLIVSRNVGSEGAGGLLLLSRTVGHVGEHIPYGSTKGEFL